MNLAIQAYQSSKETIGKEDMVVESSGAEKLVEGYLDGKNLTVALRKTQFD